MHSLALAETEQGLLEPLATIEEETRRQIAIAIGILCAVIVAAVTIAVFTSSVVAASLAGPMVFLLQMIKNINR